MRVRNWSTAPTSRSSPMGICTPWLLQRHLRKTQDATLVLLLTATALIPHQLRSMLRVIPLSLSFHEPRTKSRNMCVQ